MIKTGAKKQEAFIFGTEKILSLPKITNVPQVYLSATLVFTDIVMVVLALFLAWQVRLRVLPSFTSLYPKEMPLGIYQHLILVLFFLLVYLTIEGLYFRRLPFWRETRILLKAVLLSFLFVLAAISLGKLNNEFSRTVLVLCCLFSIIAMPLGRFGVKTMLWRWGLWAKPVLILGAGKTGELVARALLRDSYLGYKIHGFLDDDHVKKSRGIKLNDVHFPVLGGFEECEAVMEHSGVRDLIIAAPGMLPAKLVDLVNRLQRVSSSVLVIPDLFGLPVASVKADYFFDEQVLSFRVENNLANPANILLKRIFDLTIGLAILICISPVMLLLVLVIKLDSPGPVLFPHKRIGRRGESFNCYKFRTMVTNAQELLAELLKKDNSLRQEWERHYKLKNDPRITRVGAFLRKTSLDELPQLINVLKGEMSLVGPRPITEKEISHFDSYINDYCLVRPGVTGLWQVSGRSEIDYLQRVRLESWYIRNWSLWLDITLIMRTFAAVLAGNGAY